MGEVRVPADAHWGAQTQRAVENFPISGLPDRARARSTRWPLIKAEAARVNAGLREVPQVDEAGRRRDRGRGRRGRRRRASTTQFPIDAFQTGSGTSSNMNANEVIARLASDRARRRPVHPNDHVNASQSSNDVFPSAVHLAAAIGDRRRPDPGRASSWRRRCARSSASSRTVVKSRPHAPDGRDAGHARPGVRRLRRAGRGRHRPPARRAAAAVRAAARRHRGRHRHQRAEGLRRAR